MSRQDLRAILPDPDILEVVRLWVTRAGHRVLCARSGPEAPAGPDSGAARVIRGGGWLAGDPDSARASHRAQLAPERAAMDVGFRCAYDR